MEKIDYTLNRQITTTRQFVLITTSLLLLINYVYSQDTEENKINEACLKENFKKEQLEGVFTIEKEKCYNHGNKCCHIDMKYNMSGVGLDSSYCFTLKNNPNGNNMTTTEFATKIKTNLLRELTWFSNWTINNFGIYNSIGMNYPLGSAPLPKEPICIPPQPAPEPIKYCAPTSTDNSTCTPVRVFTQWGANPAIKSLALAYYNYYQHPSLSLPPCRNITPIDIMVSCKEGYISGAFIKVSITILALIIMIL